MAKQTKRLKELEAEIMDLKAIIAKQDQRIERNDRYIVRLKESLDELNREKLSLESELENLRGY
jgi:chromosome segregation ATPase